MNVKCICMIGLVVVVVIVLVVCGNLKNLFFGLISSSIIMIGMKIMIIIGIVDSEFY